MNKLKEPTNIISLIQALRSDGVPEDRYFLYVERLLERKCREIGIPKTGHFELTPLCNLDCKMCYVHLASNQFMQTELMSTTAWKQLIKQAYEAGMMEASLTGGECLTYYGFDDIYLYLYDLGIIPHVLSNGVLLDRNRISFFKKYPPKVIQVTLYGSSEDAYEKVTGKRVFQTVLQNILLMKENKLPVRITITPSKYLQTDFRQLLELVESMDIPYSINANLIPPRSNTGRIIQDAEVDKYIEIFKAQCEIRHKSLSKIDLAELPDENHSGRKRYGLKCGGGRSSFGITYEGKVCPCLSMAEIAVDPSIIGFSNAWNQINNIVKNFQLPEECADCVYENQCLQCIAMHKNSPQKGHCDPRICERTKKLICAGLKPFPQNWKE